MGALNLPSAADIERLTRRLRSVSQRLEGIEDGVHRIGRTLSGQAIETRLAGMEEQLQDAVRAGSIPEDAPLRRPPPGIPPQKRPPPQSRPQSPPQKDPAQNGPPAKRAPCQSGSGQTA